MIENNLKWCREELEMTQKELGFIFGVSNYTVHGWENGHDSIPFVKLIKFCNLYNYSLDFVTGLTRKNIQYGKFKISKEKIAKSLKKLRLSLNLTQQALADKCGLSRSTYSSYETGQYLITTTNLVYICKTLNVSMDWLVGRTNKSKINK